MIDGYKIVCEFISIQENEKILKSYPFIGVEIYHNNKLETKRRIMARFSITDKKFVLDRLSSFLIFPIIQPSKSARKISLIDVEYLFKKVKELEIPYEYIRKISYDENKDSLMIDTLLDNYLVFVKTRNSRKFSDEVIDLLERKVIKNYKHLRTIE